MRRLQENNSDFKLPQHVTVVEAKHVCTRNQPQTFRENVRINKTLNLSHLQDLSNSEAGED